MRLRQLLASVSTLFTIAILAACGGEGTSSALVQPAQDAAAQPAQDACGAASTATRSALPQPAQSDAAQSSLASPERSALVAANAPRVIYDNDAVRDAHTDDYVMALASVGKIRLRGMITSSSFEPYNHYMSARLTKAEVGARQHGINLARKAGLTGIPDATLGTVGHLRRPASGKINDTVRLGSPGTDLILQAAAQATADQPLIVLMGGPLTVVADAYLANPSLISRNVVVYYLGGNRDKGDFSEYNSWADGWAAHIVFNRLSMVIFPVELAYRPSKWISVPRARILAELRDTPHRAWMHAKDQGNGGSPRRRVHRRRCSPAVFLDDRGYVTSTLRVCPSGSIAYDGHSVPSFRIDSARECRAVLVTGTDSDRGTERWWSTMRQAYNGGRGSDDPLTTEVYRASSDYSATQGLRQWSYLTSTGQPMTFNPEKGWWQGAEAWSLISSDRVHPGRREGCDPPVDSAASGQHPNDRHCPRRARCRQQRGESVDLEESIAPLVHRDRERELLRRRLRPDSVRSRRRSDRLRCRFGRKQLLGHDDARSDDHVHGQLSRTVRVSPKNCAARPGACQAAGRSPTRVANERHDERPRSQSAGS